MSTLGRSVRTLLWLGGLAGLSAAGWVGVNKYRGSQGTGELPVAEAREGEFLAIIRCRGELRAGRSAQIYAPVVPNLRIAWMAGSGEAVEKGAPVIRFDSTTVEQQLVQKEAQLKQSQASLDQEVAQVRIDADRDQSELVDARYNVEKARLGTAANEFVGRIQAEQARIDLSVAEQKLKVQEAAMASHAASNASRMASLTRQRDQAKADVDLTKTRMSQMEVDAPLGGVVVFVSNYNQGPLNAKPFKVGDNVYSGMNLAEIPDMSSLAMDAKVEEIDRGPHRRGEGRASARGCPAGAGNSRQNHPDFAPGGAEHRLSSHAKFSRLRGAPESRLAAAAGNERRHGHRDRPSSEGDQHSGQSSVHAGRETGGVPGRARDVSPGGGPVAGAQPG